MIIVRTAQAEWVLDGAEHFEAALSRLAWWRRRAAAEWPGEFTFRCVVADDSSCEEGKPNEVTTLPWSTSEYEQLQPGDLAPVPAPTPEQRVRVAAALATVMRDAAMTGQNSGPCPNAEVIRAVLIMDAAAWASDIGALQQAFATLAYDPVDPKARFNQLADLVFFAEQALLGN